MSRGRAPRLTRTPSIPSLTPEDRVSNLSVPSNPGSYEGGDNEIERVLPVEVADAEERFAQWYTEVTRYLRQGSFAPMPDSDEMMMNEVKGGVESQRTSGPVPRMTKTKQAKRTQYEGTVKDEPTALTKRKQLLPGRKARKTAVNMPPPPQGTLGEVIVLRKRTYYPRRAKAGPEPVTGVPTCLPATESTLSQQVVPPTYGRRAPAPRPGKGVARMGTTRS